MSDLQVSSTRPQAPSDEAILAELETGQTRWIDLPKKYPGLTTQQVHDRLIVRYGYVRARAAAEASNMIHELRQTDQRHHGGFTPEVLAMRYQMLEARQAALDLVMEATAKEYTEAEEAAGAVRPPQPLPPTDAEETERDGAKAE